MQPGFWRIVVLVALAVYLMRFGAHIPAMLCFVLLVASQQVTGSPGRARAGAVLAGLLAALLFASPLAGLVYGVAAATGLLVARLAEWKWSFGWRLTTVTAVAFAGLAAVLLADWETARHSMTIFINARVAELEASDAANEQVIEFARWWDMNYANFGLGSAFGTVLFLAAFMLSVLDRVRMAPEIRVRRKPSGFQRMRVPDWVVWLAIALAALWYIDYRWPAENGVLRVATWNTALGLAVVYWLNGFAIVLYALSVFKASLFATFMVFSGFALFSSLLPGLLFLGLFDTWFDFRARCWRMALPPGETSRAGDPDL